MRKMSAKSSFLIILLALYFGSILNITFWIYIKTHVNITGFSVGIFVCTLPFFMFALMHIILNVLVIPFLDKFVIPFLMITSAVVSYMMYSYGVYIDSDMIRNTFETNTREAADLITFSVVLWTFFLGIIPSILLFFTKIEYKPLKSELKRRLFMVFLSFVIIMIIAALSYKEYASFGRNNSHVRKLVTPINYVYSVWKYFKIESLANRNFEQLDPEAKLIPYEDPALTVFVMILGETARAQNFALGGYEKNTNPTLTNEDIVYFDSVSSCGTSTAISVPCMFSNMSRKSFDVANAKFSENILDLARESDYNVFWRENDDGCKGVCDRVNSEIMIKTPNKDRYCDDKSCYDEILLDGLEEYLHNIKQDTFIVLHTIGSHGPTYYKRYPNKFRVFEPTCDTAQIQDCTQDEIINTYDNTIIYTDYIISQTIDILKKFPNHESGLLYISDHGESLGEKNIYLHGLPYAIAPKEQTNVPMILWMSENMKKYDHIDYDCMKNDAKAKSYSHDNLFHSILGLLEIKTKTYNKELDMFENCRTKALPH
ncbi:MAG: phosphoethanolamine--lipid A transferase [Campylobacteraceae bacterium]|jgi:lipid A ethanolaminephosphotransferase|nr:phosphoethanolamine--lipid A transferase [Campylobacteraceae bacterium]